MIGTIIKRTVHNNFSGLFFGLPFTKANPEFVQSVKNQFPPDRKLLLVCQEGLRYFSLSSSHFFCIIIDLDLGFLTKLVCVFVVD